MSAPWIILEKKGAAVLKAKHPVCFLAVSWAAPGVIVSKTKALGMFSAPARTGVDGAALRVCARGFSMIKVLRRLSSAGAGCVCEAWRKHHPLYIQAPENLQYHRAAWTITARELFTGGVQTKKIYRAEGEKTHKPEQTTQRLLSELCSFYGFINKNKYCPVCVNTKNIVSGYLSKPALRGHCSLVVMRLWPWTSWSSATVRGNSEQPAEGQRLLLLLGREVKQQVPVRSVYCRRAVSEDVNNLSTPVDARLVVASAKHLHS